MDESVLRQIDARVGALRTRHVVIASVLAAAGVGALGLGVVLGEAEAPLSARLFVLAACLAAAGWQVALRLRIGRGLAALRAGRPVAWVYALHASINGAHVGSSVMIGLETGERCELPLDLGADPTPVIAAVSRAHPRATSGFDAATDARFLADPRSLLR